VHIQAVLRSDGDGGRRHGEAGAHAADAPLGDAVARRRVPDPQIAVAAAGHEPRPGQELDAGDEVRVAQTEALDLLAAGELGYPHLLVAVGGRDEAIRITDARQDARRVREEPPRRLVQRRERERVQLAGAARQQDLAGAVGRDAQATHAPRRLRLAEAVAVPAAQALRVGRRRDRGAVSTYCHGDAALVVGTAQRRRRSHAPEHGAAANADDERAA